VNDEFQGRSMCAMNDEAQKSGRSSRVVNSYWNNISAPLIDFGQK